MSSDTSRPPSSVPSVDRDCQPTAIHQTGPLAAGTSTVDGGSDDIVDPTCPRVVTSGTDDPPEHLFAGAGRKAVPGVARLRLSVQRCPQVRRFLEVFDLVGDRPPPVGFRGSNGGTAGVGHEAALLHVGCAFAVQPGPGTLGSALGDQLQTALFVEDGAGG